METKINITFITANLTAGGSERVISFLAKELDRKKFNVTLVVFGYKKDTVYDIKGVETIFFEKTRVINGVFKMFRYLLKYKPDIVLSAIAHVNTLIAYQSIFFPKTKFIAREVNVLSVLDSLYKSQNHFLLSLIYKYRFKFFDAVICQSIDMLEDLNQHYNIAPHKLHVINNPISNEFKLKAKIPSEGILNCINVGRLAIEKGHNRLLMVLSKLSIPFHLTIIGKGSEFSAIFKLAEDFNLMDKITHIEFTNQVSKHLSKNDVYLQSSYVEGFPNAVIESCAVGTPVIAFNAPGGINEIIINGVNGYVAENENQFIEYIQRIHANNTFDPKEVSDSVYKRYNKEKILNQYETLFLNIIK